MAKSQKLNLTPAERKLVCDIRVMDADHIASIQATLPDSAIEFAADKFGEFAGCVAFEINHGKVTHQKRLALCRIWEKIEQAQRGEQKRNAGHPEFCDDHARIAAQAQPRFTALQGQYLAFIYYYTKLNGRPPAEADMQQRFGVTPPVVHDMVVRLEKKGLIARTPGAARSIRVLVPKDQLPDLE